MYKKISWQTKKITVLGPSVAFILFILWHDENYLLEKEKNKRNIFFSINKLRKRDEETTATTTITTSINVKCTFKLCECLCSCVIFSISPGVCVCCYVFTSLASIVLMIEIMIRNFHAFWRTHKVHYGFI